VVVRPGRSRGTMTMRSERPRESTAPSHGKSLASVRETPPPRLSPREHVPRRVASRWPVSCKRRRRVSRSRKYEEHCRGRYP
jgi:hypothetical protein